MADAAALFHVEDVLLVAIREDLSDTNVLDLQDRMASEIAAKGSRGVVVDIGALEIVDTFVGRILGQLAKTASLLDAQTYVVGMRPAVAMTLVELGMDLPEMHTALTVDHAMRRLRQTAA